MIAMTQSWARSTSGSTDCDGNHKHGTMEPGTLGIMDCDVSMNHAYLSTTTTSGDSFEYEWDLLGPCGNTGDITLELDDHRR